MKRELSRDESKLYANISWWAINRKSFTLNDIYLEVSLVFVGYLRKMLEEMTDKIISYMIEDKIIIHKEYEGGVYHYYTINDINQINDDIEKLIHDNTSFTINDIKHVIKEKSKNKRIHQINNDISLFQRFELKSSNCVCLYNDWEVININKYQINKGSFIFMDEYKNILGVLHPQQYHDQIIYMIQIDDLYKNDYNELKFRDGYNVSVEDYISIKEFIEDNFEWEYPA